MIQGPVSAATLPKCCVSQTELMQKQNGGLANPNFKDLARAIMRSQKVLQHPDMGGKCDGMQQHCLLVCTQHT